MVAPPLIVLAGFPAWAQRIGATLERQGCSLACYDDPEHYVARLVDDQAAMVIVDGDGPDWRFWTTTVKTSPATRRIPVVLVSGYATTRRMGMGAGADFSLPPGELQTQLPELVATYARVPDPAWLEALECQCREPLPPLAAEGVRRFNAGEYYRQHDLFEEQWMAEPGPVRDLYRAILQVGVAYYQIERGNHHGALKMLLRSVQWLAVLPDVCQGVDVRQLREDSHHVRAALESMDPTAIVSFDRSLLKPVKLVETG